MEETLLLRWIAAFNARDLDGMLADMDPRVRFYPLRLNGLEGSYAGHDGVRGWFARLNALGHEHRILLSDLRRENEGVVLGIGELFLGTPTEPIPVWVRDRIEAGRIVVAHHYLTDPDILSDVPPPEPSESPRSSLSDPDRVNSDSDG